MVGGDSHLSVDSVRSILWSLPIIKSELASVKLSTATSPRAM